MVRDASRSLSSGRALRGPVGDAPHHEVEKSHKVDPASLPAMIRVLAPVAELVDAPDSKSGSARSAGSSPARGTRILFLSPISSLASTWPLGLIVVRCQMSSLVERADLSRASRD